MPHSGGEPDVFDAPQVLVDVRDNPSFSEGSSDIFECPGDTIAITILFRRLI